VDRISLPRHLPRTRRGRQADHRARLARTLMLRQIQVLANNNFELGSRPIT
jgi:hypothetical protein